MRENVEKQGVEHSGLNFSLKIIYVSNSYYCSSYFLLFMSQIHVTVVFSKLTFIKKIYPKCPAPRLRVIKMQHLIGIAVMNCKIIM